MKLILIERCRSALNGRNILTPLWYKTGMSVMMPKALLLNGPVLQPLF